MLLPDELAQKVVFANAHNDIRGSCSKSALIVSIVFLARDDSVRTPLFPLSRKYLTRSLYNETELLLVVCTMNQIRSIPFLLTGRISEFVEDPPCSVLSTKTVLVVISTSQQAGYEVILYLYCTCVVLNVGVERGTYIPPSKKSCWKHEAMQERLMALFPRMAACVWKALGSRGRFLLSSIRKYNQTFL